MLIQGDIHLAVVSFIPFRGNFNFQFFNETTQCLFVYSFDMCLRRENTSGKLNVEK